MEALSPAIPEAPEQAEERFEFTIEPPGRWVSINWPELWRYRELFLVMAWRDIAVRYKQTALGALWAILQPVVNMVLFTAIFNRVGRIDSGDPNIPYPIFVYVGLLFWQMYANTLTNASNSMVQNAGMIQKVYFPRLIIPGTAAITSLVDMAIASLVLAAMMIYYHTYSHLAGLAMLPVLLVLGTTAAMGVGLFLAALNVKYRDVRHALPFVIQTLMFVTPLIYPVSMLAKHPVIQALVLWLNPIGGVITMARTALIGNGTVDFELLGITAVMSIVFMIAGLYYFRATERYFADIA